MRVRLALVVGLICLLSFNISKANQIESKEQLLANNVFMELPEEVQKMHAIFDEMVSSEVVVNIDYMNHLSQDAVRILLTLGEGARRSQYFLYVDRNPKEQIAFVGFFDAKDKKAVIIGLDKISSGNGKRKGYFWTPTGVFKNSLDSMSYRALGTKNKNGWRGLGVKGSRVWDFGWQKTIKNGEERMIRLLLHATDPVYGEKSLGKINSKGCIRISGKFNQFLDHYGLLDRAYEAQRNDKRMAWVLKANREPVLFAGQYLLVGDSAR